MDGKIKYEDKKIILGAVFFKDMIFTLNVS